MVHAHRASTKFIEVNDSTILDDIDDPASFAAWSDARRAGK